MLKVFWILVIAGVTPDGQPFSTTMNLKSEKQCLEAGAIAEKYAVENNWIASGQRCDPFDPKKLLTNTTNS